MSNPEHIELFKQGRKTVEQWIALHPDQSFDLSSMALNGYDFSGWRLTKANFSQCNFGAANFSNAILDKANLESASLFGANLSNAILSFANCKNANFQDALFANSKLEGTQFQGATLSRARNLPKGLLREATLSGAYLDDTDLDGVDLSGRNLSHTRFNNSTLKNANLSNAILNGAELQSANLSNANLNHSSLHNADIRTADLNSAILTQADFYESIVNRASFKGAIGLTKARNLHLVRFEKDQGDVRYFEFIVIPRIEKIISWERIRFLGRLPLFGASYSALIAIPILYYFLDFYNRKVDVIKTWAMQEISQNGIYSYGAKKIIAHLHHEPIPSLSLTLLISTFLLGAGATIFAFGCPARIREFSRDQWKDELGHSLIYYLPQTWWYLWLRIFCVLFYTVGGAGVIFVLISKLWNVFNFIIENS
jgi:uncharacterized protein YjbI with pentapeptide repeats